MLSNTGYLLVAAASVHTLNSVDLKIKESAPKAEFRLAQPRDLDVTQGIKTASGP